MERKLTITDEYGVHARPATKVVRAANEFEETITLIYEDSIANLKSILGVMSLGITCGSTVTLKVEGANEEHAMISLVHTFKESGLIK